MAGAQLFILLHGTAMTGVGIGGATGAAAGLFGGTALVLWDNGRWAGHALAWLGVGALLMIVCLVWVALS